MWWRRGKVHNLDESHDGQTLTVAAGELVWITLPHSSVDKWGFEWPYDPSQSQAIYFYGDEQVETGVQRLQFQAAASGSETLKLERKQTPGNGNAVIKTLTVTIEVDGAGDDDVDEWC